MSETRKHDIIVFSYSDWRASWSTPQQLMTRVAARGHRVLYVDQPRSFLYGLKGADPQGAGAWDGAALQPVQNNLWVFHPPTRFLPLGGLPFPISRHVLQMNGKMLGQQVREAAAGLGFRDAILWNFSPCTPGRWTMCRIPWMCTTLRTTG